MAGVRTLVVLYPDWPIVAAGRSADEPVVVVSANRVVALSDGARREGVRLGLRRREAQGRCPDLDVVAADPARDARAWEPAVAAVEHFTPAVEIVRPGVLAVATRGPSRYFGGDRALAARLVAAVHAAVGGCPVEADRPVDGGRPVEGGRPVVQAGVADGRFAAGLAAEAAAGPAGASADGGDRVLVVPAGGSGEWLATWPVTTLGPESLTDLLVRLGIRTLGQLADLPARSVLGRFGPDGATAHRLARGLDDSPLDARTPPPDLAVTAELDPPADRVDTAAFLARALATDLHQRLADSGLACTRILIEAETEHGERLSRLWRHDGALSAGAVAERVRWQLDAWLTGGRQAEDPLGGSTSGGLTLLRLVPDEVHPDHGRQLGFWGGSTAADARVARALARVQGLLGPDAVVTAVLGGGRDPGDQVRLVPWGEPREPARPGLAAWPGATPGEVRSDPPATTGEATSRVRGAPGPQAHRGGPDARRTLPAPTRRRGTPAEIPPWPGRLPGPAPAVVHRPGRPADVRDAGGAPVTVNGRGEISASPAEVVVDGGAWRPVVGWAGPWPVEERWWEPDGRRRARCQVCLADGTALLVVREGSRWWVEATYD